MIDILKTYFSPILHPYGAYDIYTDKPLFGRGNRKLDFVEAITVSWFFSFFKGMMTLGYIYLGYWTFDFFHLEYFNLFEEFEIPLKFEGHRFLVLMTVLEIILFPLALWLMASFWKGTIKIFAELFTEDSTIAEKSEDIVTMSMSSHVFYIIPFFGEFLQQLFTIIYIYAGLKKRIGLSSMQSIFIIVSPILVLGGLLALLVLLLGLFIQTV